MQLAVFFQIITKIEIHSSKKSAMSSVREIAEKITLMKSFSDKCVAKDIYICPRPAMKFKHRQKVFVFGFFV